MARYYPIRTKMLFIRVQYARDKVNSKYHSEQQPIGSTIDAISGRRFAARRSNGRKVQKGEWTTLVDRGGLKISVALRRGDLMKAVVNFCSRPSIRPRRHFSAVCVLPRITGLIFHLA
jgi:hypothetical protein